MIRAVVVGLVLLLSPIGVRAADVLVKTGDRVELANDFGAGGEFTVSIWGRFLRGINPQLGHMRAALVSRGTREIEPASEQFVLSLRGGRPEFKYIPEKGGRCGIMRNDVYWCGNGVKVRDVELEQVKPDMWFRVTGVFDHGTISLYLDDRLYLVSSNNPAPPCNSLPVKIGQVDSPYGMAADGFPGALAMPRFESRAKVAEEIVAEYAAERKCLPEKVGEFNFDLRSFDNRFERERRYTEALPAKMPARSNCVVRIARVGGVPRVTIDGVAKAAMAMLPDHLAKTNETVKSAREFAAYGVRFFSDIQFTEGARNDWWLAEGVYDWPRFEARMRALISVNPEGWVFPRIKVDAPDWWRKGHGGEFMGNGRVKPHSVAWRALYTRMLRDVVGHVEASDLAGYVMGYQVGAYVGGEWLARSPEAKPEDIADAVLLAAGVIKKVTRGNKLTGVFFGYPGMDHSAFGRLLESPLIDYYCGPTAYFGRRGGEPGRFSSNAQASMRLHGRLYWDEADLRTSICREVVDYRCADMDETVNCVKRAIGWALTAGEEVWWFLIAGNASFHDERIMETVEIGRREEERTLTMGESPVEDIAIFVPTATYLAKGGRRVNYELLAGGILPRIGYTYGTYVLDDLRYAEKLPAHRLVMVPDREGLTEDQREMCEILARRGMRVEHIGRTPTREELRAKARAAGAHEWIETPDTLAAGRGYVMLHASTAGEKRIHLPWKSEVREVFGAAKARAAVSTISDEFRAGETRVYYLGSPLLHPKNTR